MMKLNSPVEILIHDTLMLVKEKDFSNAMVYLLEALALLQKEISRKKS
jgi:hypothetical protein